VTDPEFHNLFPAEFNAARIDGLGTFIEVHKADDSPDGHTAALLAFGREMFNHGVRVGLEARERVNT
jgi:hypothetical protein